LRRIVAVDGHVKPEKRHEEISRLVRRAGELSVDDLAVRLGVSRETIRRDLTHLDARGAVKKFHGGARKPSEQASAPLSEGPFTHRLAENAAAKRKIALRACELLVPGDSLFIDTGTTTLLLAEVLVERPPLVVITNSCRIAATLAANPTHKVMLIGGAYSADAGQSVGQFAVEQIRRFRAQHAFLTVGAVDARAVMDFDAQEAEIAQAMIERVDRVTVLADHSKFDRRGVFEVAPLNAVAALVTDGSPPVATERALVAAGVEILKAD
jgi:DeoR family transcriptional regulator, glycerol-3-phosphate regulon repressor